MRQYCLTCRQSQRKRTHSHKYARNTQAWTNHTAIGGVDKSRCQGHEFALNAVWPSSRVCKLLSSNYNKSLFWSISDDTFQNVILHPNHSILTSLKYLILHKYVPIIIESCKNEHPSEKQNCTLISIFQWQPIQLIRVKSQVNILFVP